MLGGEKKKVSEYEGIPDWLPKMCLIQRGARLGWDELYHALKEEWEGGRRGHNQSLPEIEMKHPNSGLGDIISHVNQAKHRAATFVSCYI